MAFVPSPPLTFTVSFSRPTRTAFRQLIYLSLPPSILIYRCNAFNPLFLPLKRRSESKMALLRPAIPAPLLPPRSFLSGLGRGRSSLGKYAHVKNCRSWCACVREWACARGCRQDCRWPKRNLDRTRRPTAFKAPPRAPPISPCITGRPPIGRQSDSDIRTDTE